MNSVFDTLEKIHKIYDLKGSLIGREITEKQREKDGVYKDMGMNECLYVYDIRACFIHTYMSIVHVYRNVFINQYFLVF